MDVKRHAWNSAPWIAFLAIVGVAAAFRFTDLELRPVHGDEANQAYRAGILLETGEYRYDPHEHHGPTLYYLTLPLLRRHASAAFRDTVISDYRSVPAFFGTVLLLLVWPLRGALGVWGVCWAALFLAVSHAMTYYSRYYIQETLLVFCIQGALTAGWWYTRKPGILPALVLGTALGLAHATKGTWVLAAAAAAGAVPAALIFGRIRDGWSFRDQTPWAANTRIPRHVLVALAAFAFVSITFFSSFFTHARGPLDSLLAFGYYLPRAGGEGSVAVHSQPWHYYLSLLLHTHRQAGPRWTEALILFLSVAAMIGVAAARRPNPGMPDGPTQERAAWFRRFLVFYTLFVTVLYALIPYKTPWNLLVFLHAMALLAGWGAVMILRIGRWRGVQALLLALLFAGTAHLAWQSYQGNFVYPADTRNPYVYAHTSTALRRLVRRVNDLARVAESGKNMHISVVQPGGDYWPLPWCLRRFDRVGWWTAVPERPDADVIIAAAALADPLRARLQNDYVEEIHALRPGILLQVFIQRDLWNAFMAGRQ